jgi:hypothetical protein
MGLMIQHEYFREVLSEDADKRDVELDAKRTDGHQEKCFTDADMWRVHEQGA